MFTRIRQRRALRKGTNSNRSCAALSWTMKGKHIKQQHCDLRVSFCLSFCYTSECSVCSMTSSFPKDRIQTKSPSHHSRQPTARRLALKLRRVALRSRVWAPTLQILNGCRDSKSPGVTCSSDERTVPHGPWRWRMT